MAFVCILKYRHDFSISKHFCVADQGLFDCLVPSKDHHLLWSKINGKHRPVGLGKLEELRNEDKQMN